MKFLVPAKDLKPKITVTFPRVCINNSQTHPSWNPDESFNCCSQ